MSIGYKIRNFFSNHAETKDRHVDKKLQTHYYKSSKDSVMKVIESYFASKDTYSINAVSKEHGEVSATTKKGKRVFIVATIIMVRPYHTAIDFSVTTESLLQLDFGHSSKVIQELYEHINKELQLISEH
ncbi:cytosolic protein [Oceanobacillus iheyensis]|uniref:cytosolic protein n=1 Tax=Oceanobacillus iheyensis TaxID=182710 RepID=UPI00363023EF